MNTFRCSNCGFQIQRPTQPFSCPQCGRQAVGLFRVVAFTPPEQGGWPGQRPAAAAGYAAATGWPQQPGMPQQPGIDAAGHVPRNAAAAGNPATVPGGWPVQPQVPQQPANPWGQQPACRRGRSVGRATGMRSNPPAAAAGHAPAGRVARPAARSAAPRRIPGANNPLCRCRNHRPSAVGPAQPGMPQQPVRRSSRACHSRRRPGPAACSNRPPPRGRGSRRWGSRVFRRRRASAAPRSPPGCRRGIRSRRCPHAAATAGPPAAPPGIKAARPGPQPPSPRTGSAAAAASRRAARHGNRHPVRSPRRKGLQPVPPRPFQRRRDPGRAAGIPSPPRAR